MKCKVCLNTIKPLLLLESKSNSSSVYRCPNCKVAFASPQPTPAILDAYYNGMYSELTVSFNEKKMKWAQNSLIGYASEIKHILSKEINGLSFLDLGGGLGYYTKAAEEAGFDAILVEKDPVSVEFAKETLGIQKILPLDMNNFFETTTEKYDVVLFRHVIEHVTEPFEVIKSISKIVKDDGLLIIETDNNAGIEILFSPGSRKFYKGLYSEKFNKISTLSLLKKRPFALDPPRHLFGFRMANLSNLLNNNGLVPQVKVHYRLGDTVYWPNYPNPKLKSVVKEFLKLKLMSGFNKLSAFINLIFRRILQKIGLSSGLCIYAQKKN